MILTYGDKANPGKLWEEHKSALTYDILYKERIRLNDRELKINSDIENLSLYYPSEILQSYHKNLTDFVGMPILPIDFDHNTLPIYVFLN